jgi:hypothetical protein
MSCGHFPHYYEYYYSARPTICWHCGGQYASLPAYPSTFSSSICSAVTSRASSSVTSAARLNYDRRQRRRRRASTGGSSSYKPAAETLTRPLRDANGEEDYLGRVMPKRHNAAVAAVASDTDGMSHRGTSTDTNRMSHRRTSTDTEDVSRRHHHHGRPGWFRPDCCAVASMTPRPHQTPTPLESAKTNSPNINDDDTGGGGGGRRCGFCCCCFVMSFIPGGGGASRAAGAAFNQEEELKLPKCLRFERSNVTKFLYALALVAATALMSSMLVPAVQHWLQETFR